MFLSKEVQASFPCREYLQLWPVGYEGLSNLPQYIAEVPFSKYIFMYKIVKQIKNQPTSILFYTIGI